MVKRKGSSRKVVGFEPGNRQGEIADESKEIPVIPVAVANTFGDLDLVVEALQLAGADRENSVRDKPVQARPFQFSELHKGRNVAGLSSIEPAFPARKGSDRIRKFEKFAKLFLHRIADRKV